jgi:hypothetical protein
VELYKTAHTERLLERWEEVHELDPSFPYPIEAIEAQNWPAVSEELKNHETLLRREHGHGDFDFFTYIRTGEGDLQEKFGEKE